MLRSQRARALARAHRTAGADPSSRIITVPHAESSKHALARARRLEHAPVRHYSAAVTLDPARRSHRTYGSAGVAVQEAESDLELDDLDSSDSLPGASTETEPRTKDETEAGSWVWNNVVVHPRPYRPIRGEQHRSFRRADILAKRNKLGIAERMNDGVRQAGWKRDPWQPDPPVFSNTLLASPSMIKGSTSTLPDISWQSPTSYSDQELLHYFLRFPTIPRNRLPEPSKPMLDRLTELLKRKAAEDPQWWRAAEWQVEPGAPPNIMRSLLKLRAIFGILPSRDEAAKTSFAFIRSVDLHLFCEVCLALNARSLFVSTMGKVIAIEGLFERRVPPGTERDRREQAATEFAPYIQTCLTLLLNHGDRVNAMRIWHIMERHLPVETLAAILGIYGIKTIMQIALRLKKPYIARQAYRLATDFLAADINILTPLAIETYMREGDTASAQKLLSTQKDLSKAQYSELQERMLRSHTTLGFDEGAELRILDDLDADRLTSPIVFLNTLIALRMRAGRLKQAKNLFARIRLDDTAIGIKDDRPLVEPDDVTRQLALEWVLRAEEPNKLFHWWEFMRKDKRLQTDRAFAIFLREIIDAGYYREAKALFFASAGMSTDEIEGVDSEVSEFSIFDPGSETASSRLLVPVEQEDPPRSILRPISGFQPGPKTCHVVLQRISYKRNVREYKATILVMQKLGLPATDGVLATFFPFIRTMPFVTANDMAAVAHAMTSLSGLPESQLLLDIVIQHAVELTTRKRHTWLRIAMPSLELDDQAGQVVDAIDAAGGFKAFVAEPDLRQMIDNMSKTGARPSASASMHIMQYQVSQAAADDEFTSVRKIWVRYLKQGYKPSSLSMQALIRGVMTGMRRQDIVRVFALARSLNIPVDREMLHLFLKALLYGPKSSRRHAISLGTFRQASRVYEQIRRLGVNDSRLGINAETMEIMIAGCARFHQWDFGHELIEKDFPAFRSLNPRLENVIFGFYLSRVGWGHRALDWLDSSSYKGSLNVITYGAARATRDFLQRASEKMGADSDIDETVIERLNEYMARFAEEHVGDLTPGLFLAYRDRGRWKHLMRIAEMLVRLNRPIRDGTITYWPPGLGKAYQVHVDQEPFLRPPWDSLVGSAERAVGSEQRADSSDASQPADKPTGS